MMSGLSTIYCEEEHIFLDSGDYNKKIILIK